MNATNSKIRRLVYIRHVAVTTSLGFPEWAERRGSRPERRIGWSAEGAEEGGRLFVGIRLEIQMDVDDEGRAEGREQTGLRK